MESGRTRGARHGDFLFRFGPAKATIPDDMIWAGHPHLPLGNPNPSSIYDDSPVEDRKEVAIEPRTEEAFTADQIGWRFALGTALIVGGYGAWSLIPVVIEADLEPSAKAFLSGLFGATPFLTKVAAVALMGRPAYNFLKRTLFQWLRRRWSRQPD
jgi:hypothetical protein